MSFFVLLGKEISSLKKNLGVLIILFLVPIFIIFVMGFAFQDEESSYDLGIVNEVLTNEGMVPGFIDSIKKIDALNITTYENEEEAKKEINRGNILGYIVIPQDFVEKEESTEGQAKIYFYVDEAKPISSQALKGILNGYVEKYNTISTGVATAIHVMQLNEENTDCPKVIDQALEYLEGGNDRISLQTSYIGAQKKNNSMSSYNQTTCGMTAMFILFLCLLWGSSNILEEKLDGTMTRLSLAPIRFSTILGAKMFYIGILAFFQFVVFFTVGHFVLDVPTGNIWILAIFNILFIIQAASLGLLVSVIAKNRIMSIGISFFLIMVLSPLGGLWFPLETVPEAFRTFSSFLPSGAYMLGLDKIIIQNRGFESIISNCVVITVYFIVSFVASIYIQKKSVK